MIMVFASKPLKGQLVPGRTQAISGYSLGGDLNLDSVIVHSFERPNTPGDD